jgi:aspartyl/asparaginyl beta-hydroxylase (cupin superfamily)
MSEALWYCSNKLNYNKNNTRYYNVKEYPWAISIEENWQKIKTEVQNFIAEKDKSFVSNETAYKGIESAKGWSSLSSMFWGLHTNDDVAKKCPALFNMLYAVPGIVSISFSRLEPRTKIGEHHGETNAIIRCHLGIEVPAGLPECGMNVSGEEKEWEEGKWLFFNDAQHHFAWNNTDKRRIILIVDVIRPEFIHKKNLICARVLAEYSLGQRENKYSFIKNLPQVVKSLFIMTAVPLIYLVRPVSNFFKGKAN